MQKRAILAVDRNGFWIKPGLLLIALVMISGGRDVLAERLLRMSSHET